VHRMGSGTRLRRAVAAAPVRPILMTFPPAPCVVGAQSIDAGRALVRLPGAGRLRRQAAFVRSDPPCPAALARGRSSRAGAVRQSGRSRSGRRFWGRRWRRPPPRGESQRTGQFWRNACNPFSGDARAVRPRPRWFSLRFQKHNAGDLRVQGDRPGRRMLIGSAELSCSFPFRRHRHAHHHADAAQRRAWSISGGARVGAGRVARHG
jgi:hypothetical protein